MNETHLNEKRRVPVVAAPLAHIIGIALLMEFPERVDPAFEHFLLTLFTSLVIACLTVSYCSFRAAVANPVKSLRSE